MDFTKKLDVAMKELTTKGAFLTVKGEDVVNTMTISWGFVGFLWQKPHFIALVRPQRYTNEVLKHADSFTVSIPFGDAFKKQLGICGTKSGRDIDKSEIVEFVDAKAVASPVVKGCGMYYECKIDYTQDTDGTAIPREIVDAFYKDDFHTMYFGEIVECYEG